MTVVAGLPPFLILDPLIQSWLVEDIGRGDRTTQAIFAESTAEILGQAEWTAKEPGIVAGLPIAQRVFRILSAQANFAATLVEGATCESETTVARLHGPAEALLMGERVALNLVMHLSGIATLTRRYVEQISDLPTQLVDTRKTTPGLRLLEKYATQVGGAVNHRLGLDDAVMIKDNHILAAGSIEAAIARARAQVPFPLTIEVETETLEDVEAALTHQADIIMLDNMPLDKMQQAVELIRQQRPVTKIEASGNITLKTLRTVAQTGVDFISTSAPITQSPWLDLSMNFLPSSQTLVNSAI